VKVGAALRAQFAGPRLGGTRHGRKAHTGTPPAASVRLREGHERSRPRPIDHE
jgi:hypothetical protein